MNSYKAFNIEECGFSHLASGLPKQDNSRSVMNADYSIATIADGHGSSQYIRSDRGSKFAVDICVNLISDLFTKGKDCLLYTSPSPRDTR